MTQTTTYATDGGDLVIEFDYEPGERMTRDDPGCPAGVDVVSVTAGGFEILDWLSDASIALLKEKCIESTEQA